MDTFEIIEILKSDTCQCGQPKGYKMVFCRTCYGKLPPAIQKALYQRIGFGFEQSYDLACEYLDGEK